jgi:hypothetical protein
MNSQMIFEILLRILADRVLLFSTLFLNFGLYAYAMYEPNQWRFALSVMFSVVVFFPILQKTKSAQQIAQEQKEAA